MAEPVDAIVIGAGIAGIACAAELVARGADCLVLESSDKPSGRVASDKLDGCTLDRGFQVFLTAYPEASRLLENEPLQLLSLGARRGIRHAGAFSPAFGPLATPTTPVETLFDKLRLAHPAEKDDKMPTGSAVRSSRRPRHAGYRRRRRATACAVAESISHPDAGSGITTIRRSDDLPTTTGVALGLFGS